MLWLPFLLLFPSTGNSWTLSVYVFVQKNDGNSGMCEAACPDRKTVQQESSTSISLSLPGKVCRNLYWGVLNRKFALFSLNITSHAIHCAGIQASVRCIDSSTCLDETQLWRGWIFTETFLSMLNISVTYGIWPQFASISNECLSHDQTIKSIENRSIEKICEVPQLTVLKQHEFLTIGWAKSLKRH